MKNKKGNLSDTLWIAGIIFGSAIMLLLIYFVWSQIAPNLNESLTAAMSDHGATYNVTEKNAQLSSALTLYDAMFPFFMIGLVIFVIISAFFMKSHPAFFFISILLLAIFIVVTIIFSNVYQQVSETSELADATSEFVITTLVMQMLPYLILITGFIVSIIYFAKPGGGNSP